MGRVTIENALERIIDGIEREAVNEYRSLLIRHLRGMNLEGSKDFEAGWYRATERVEDLDPHAPH